jgi:plastocyanin
VVALVALGLFEASCVPTSQVPTSGSTGVEVTVATAAGDRLAFEPAEVSVRAAGPLTMTFRNRSKVAHNLVFTSGITAATSTIVEPGTSERLSLVALEPGSYRFVCTIHDGMAGTLIVEPVSATR